MLGGDTDDDKSGDHSTETPLANEVGEDNHELNPFTKVKDGDDCDHSEEQRRNKTCIEEEEDPLSLLREIFPDASQEELQEMHYGRVHRKTKPQNSAEGEDLINLHNNPNSVQSQTAPDNLSSPLGKCVTKLLSRDGKKKLSVSRSPLPDDFLRLPQQLTECSKQIFSPQHEQDRLKELEKTVSACHTEYDLHPNCIDFHDFLSKNGYTDFTKVLHRDADIGLGLTIMEYTGFIFVQALVSKDGGKIFNNQTYQYAITNGDFHMNQMGPAGQLGIQPKDRILGINGIPFHEDVLIETFDDEKTDNSDPNLVAKPSQFSFLRKVAMILKNSSDPIVLHFRRYKNPEIYESFEKSNGSLTQPEKNITYNKYPAEVKKSFKEKQLNTPKLKILPHPLTNSLANRGLIDLQKDEENITRLIQQYAERTFQWESTSKLRISISKPHKLRSHFIEKSNLPENNFSLPTSVHNVTKLQYSAFVIKPLDNRNTTNNLCTDDSSVSSDNDYLSPKRPVHPTSDLQSTPISLMKTRGNNQFSLGEKQTNEIIINMMPVRKGLNIRILNSFLDQDQIAYTIWVLDTESGKEWYAPIRYYHDFKDLRSATMSFTDAVNQIPFPTSVWFNEKSVSFYVREQRCDQLEMFLRTLSGFLYHGPLHPNMVEISIHLQSFLGCDTCIVDEKVTLALHNQVTLINSAFKLHFIKSCGDELKCLKSQLNRSFQIYVYRVFCLPIFGKFTHQFIANIKSNILTIEQMQTLDRQSRTALKERILSDLEKIKLFLDQLTDLICEGCENDFISIFEHQTYNLLREEKKVGNLKVFLDSVMHESVREQVESEVYVPLRSFISKQLVNGWRHDDMEINFKVKVLKNRSQSFFNIPLYHQSRSNWYDAVMILKEGVGLSTLPITKLNALVLAAKEIAILHEKEHKNRTKSESKNSLKNFEENEDTYTSLGADDFLPIFIYCIVQAEIERPCALCVLLRTLCDPSRRIGETGYYLASFEASITHIKEIDLMSKTNDIND